MKKQYLFLLAFVLLFSLQSYSSHIRGGELTWKCVVENGISKYKFTLRAYRECSQCLICMPEVDYIKICNSTGQLSLTLNNSNIPNSSVSRINTDGNINLLRVLNNVDVNLGCTNPTVNPLSCATSEYLSNSMYVYESGPIDLTGINPPTNAFSPILFVWNAIGRPTATNTNTAVDGSNLIVTAKMFPYILNGSNTPVSIGHCYDSSPDFAELPVFNINTSGNDYVLNFNAIDVDLDNLYFSFEDILTNLNNQGCPTTVSPTSIWENYPAYNANNPFGLLPAHRELNNTTGEYRIKPLIGGSFFVAMNVASYRDNQKISEITRDIIVNSIIPNQNYNNVAPIIKAPFTNANGTPSFQKTFTAGDKIQIPIVVRDSALSGAGISTQTLELTVNGVAMGLQNSDTNIGCPYPPCASLNRFKDNAPYTPFNLAPINITNSAGILFGYGYNLPGPYGSVNNDTLWIYWGTNCGNLKFDSSTNALASEKFDFVISVKDDYCRIPSKSTKIISVVLNPPSTLLQTNLTCVSYNKVSNHVELNWANTIGANTNTFVAYQLYRNNTLIHTSTNVNSLFYIDSSVNASADSFYAIKLISTCNITSNLQFEKVIKPISISASLNKKDKAIITWSPINTGKTLNSNGYKVYRSIGNTPYNWVQISDADGNNFNTTATDNVSLCGLTMYYKVEALDINNCVYESNLDSIINSPILVNITKKNKCANDVIKFKADNLSGGVLPYTTIRWVGDDGLFSLNKDSVLYTYNTPGMKKITYTVIDAIGCRYDFIDSILIRKSPVVNVRIDSACPGAIINIDIIQDSPDPDDSVFVYGDNGMFSKAGPYFDPFFSNPKWIFMSNNGIGKFPINIKVTKRFGCSITRVDTVYISEPSVFIANDSSTCCNTNTDTLRFYSKYLSKPYSTIHWYDDVTNSIILSNSEVLPVSLLITNTNMRIKLYVQDSKNCIATDIKHFSIGTGISENKNVSIEVFPNPTNGVLKFMSSISLQHANISIYNTLGQLVLQKGIEQNEINVEVLPQGIYSFSVEFEGRNLRGKFIKQ